MNDKTEPTLKEVLATLEYLGTEMIKYQQATRDAVVSLAEAIAGVRQKVEQGKTPPPETNPEPAVEITSVDETKTEPVTINQVRELFAEKSRAGHKDALKAILESYGAKKLPDLPTDKLAEIKAKAESL